MAVRTEISGQEVHSDSVFMHNITKRGFFFNSMILCRAALPKRKEALPDGHIYT